jgi:hypothetical protein
VYSTCNSIRATIAMGIREKTKDLFSWRKKSPDKQGDVASKSSSSPLPPAPNRTESSAPPAQSPADGEQSSDPVQLSSTRMPTSLPSTPNRTKPSIPSAPAQSPADGGVSPDPVQALPTSTPKRTEDTATKDSASPNDVFKSVYNGLKQALEVTKPVIGLAPVPGLKNAIEGILAIIEIVEVRTPCFLMHVLLTICAVLFMQNVKANKEEFGKLDEDLKSMADFLLLEESARMDGEYAKVVGNLNR